MEDPYRYVLVWQSGTSFLSLSGATFKNCVGLSTNNHQLFKQLEAVDGSEPEKELSKSPLENIELTASEIPLSAEKKFIGSVTSTEVKQTSTISIIGYQQHGLLKSAQPIPHDKSIALQLIQQAKIIPKQNQDQNMLEIIFPKHVLARQFAHELNLIIISYVPKKEPKKPYTRHKGDGKDEHIILLNDEEYNTVLDNKDAYTQLLSQYSLTLK
jgi:hypothetical protein